MGAGFGGLNAVRALARSPVRITVVDRRNHHLFQPLLYQVATAALSPADIAYPVRSILRRQENAAVLLAEAVSVDRAARELVLSDGRVGFDYLVLAPGARHAYFGNDVWEASAPGLKSLEDALEIRRRILLAFERAERETDPTRRRALLTFVIVGGGPTGVELAGAIAEISRNVLVSDFRSIDPREAKIQVLEAGPRILPTFPPGLAGKAKRALERLGVQVRAGCPVRGVGEGSVEAGDSSIPAGTILWAAGVRASPLARTLQVPLDGAGRVLVEPDLSIPGDPRIFGIGDVEALPIPRQGQPRGDRTGAGDCGFRPTPDVGVRRVARLVLHPHPFPHRIPQPRAGALRVGMGVLHRPARRAAHHRAHRPTARLNRGQASPLIARGA